MKLLQYELLKKFEHISLFFGESQESLGFTEAEYLIVAKIFGYMKWIEEDKNDTELRNWFLTVRQQYSEDYRKLLKLLSGI